MMKLQSPSVIVVASKNELPPSRQVWGSEQWIPPERREALDWLTLSRLLGWTVSIAYDSHTLGRLITKDLRCVVITTDPARVPKFLARLTSAFENQPILVVIAPRVGDSSSSGLFGGEQSPGAVTGRSIRWLGSGRTKIWICRKGLESRVLRPTNEETVWATLEDQPIVIARRVGRGTIARLGFDPSRARDAEAGATALLKHLLIWGSAPPVAWFDVENSIVLRMDDPGGAQNVHLRSWSYSKLSESEWAAIGARLKEHNARLTLGYIPGWVDDGDASRGSVKVDSIDIERVPGNIYPSPLVIYHDVAGNAPGTLNDYQSEFRGIQELRSLGLCEVELHGYTHMHPNTAAWAASADRYQNASWYHDLRLETQQLSVSSFKRLISKLPSIILDKMMNRKSEKDPIEMGLANLIEHFGVGPTTLICPQHIISLSAQKRALDFDFVFLSNNYLALRDQNRWCWSTHVALVNFDEPDGTWFDAGLPVIVHFHDRDLAQKGVEWFAHHLDSWKAAGARKFMDFRELAGVVNRRVLLVEQDGELMLNINGENPPLVRPLSVLIRLAGEMKSSKISTVVDNGELSLPIHLVSDGLARVIIPTSPPQINVGVKVELPTGSIHADPNPIPVKDASGTGITRLFWESSNASLVEVHVDSPDGPLLSSETPFGSFTTGKWVRDGMSFHLQDVTGGLPLFVENTLDVVTVRVEPLEEVIGEIHSFAAFLAERIGCTHMIDFSGGASNKLTNLQPQLEVIAIGSAKNRECRPEPSAFCTWIEQDLNQPGWITLSEKILKRSVIVCSGVIDGLGNPGYLLENLNNWLKLSPICIISVPEVSQDRTYEKSKLLNLERELQSRNLHFEFSGWTTDDAVVILSKLSGAENLIEKAPADFKVVAVMIGHNEEDIIVPSLQHLIDQGILIYFIDNWSTDSTYDLAKQFDGRGIIGHERFPQQDSKRYNWSALLKRVEEVTKEISADWFIHHDIDEVRSSPWSGINLKDGIFRVDRQGFNSIDHTVIEFPPVNNEFVPGSNFAEYFRHFEFGWQAGHFLQIKAWKNLGEPVSLADSGGHNASFKGQKVYPYKFLLKHYPIRSQKHGEKKVFYDRKPRWDAKERAAGWHSHYDPIQPGHVFLRSPSELEIYDESSFNKEYLLQRLSGVGVKRKQPNQMSPHKKMMRDSNSN